MLRRRIGLATALAIAVSPVAASRNDAPGAYGWGRLCAFGEYPASRAPRPPAPVPVASCQPVPTSYQSLGAVGDGGDTSVNLTIGADPTTQRLCYVANGLPNPPVLRVGVGHRLSIQITNTLLDTGTQNEVNCAIDTFGAEGNCLPQPIFNGRPGPDGGFYPIMANQAHAADGTSNLHVHGLFVSPRPCSDEVLRTSIYPQNWGGPVARTPGCQAAANSVTYSYDIPTDHPAGLYWYHTHRHGQAEAQTQMGLAGAIVVEDAGDAWRASLGVTDEVLVVTDIPKSICLNPANCDAARTLDAAAAPNATTPAPVLAQSPAPAPDLAIPAPQGGVTLDPRIDQLHQAGECAAGATNRTGGIELWKLRLNGAPVPESYPDFPPDSALLTKTMQPGQRQIFRLVNASADSFLAPQLVLSQNGTLTALPLEVFARDGVGLADAAGRRHFERVSHKLIVPPSGRIEFVVHAPPVGAALYLQDNRVYPGCGGNAYPARRLLLITAAGTPVDPGSADDSDLLAHEPFMKTYLDSLGGLASVHRVFVLSEYARGFTYGQTKWIGGTPNPFQYNPNATDFFITEVAADDGSVIPAQIALRPFAHNAPPNVVVHLRGRTSVTEEWLVENSTLETHAFHIHQIHFRDITNPGLEPAAQPLLDVIDVPSAPLIGSTATGGPGAPGWVRLRMTFTDRDIGEFVYHCHILEHEDNGMMGKIRVVAD